MRSPGNVLSGDRGAVELATAGAELLRHAREREAHGGLVEAIAAYDRTIEAAVRDGDEMVLAEALRRVAIVRHHRGDTARARQECRRSYSLARAIRNDVLAAEALNTLGGLDLTTGFLEDARHAFIRALELAEESMPLRARVEQNLGIVANIQGELDAALVHYRRSLDAYRAGNDQHGCAIAYNNLGMVSADRERWDEAEDYFRKCHGLALAVGDRYLQGLVLVNQAEVDVARQRFENGRRSAEQALLVFAELGATNGKSDAYRVIGSIYRETGRPALSESRLRTAVDLAEASGSVLAEAEAHRELALLFQGDGRNQDALRRLNTAHRLFRRLDARAELVYVGGKMAELEGTYRAVVRDWGRAIELRHRGTFGHSERVARHAVAVARALGLEPQQETTILLGAYLHDVGKTRIPPEVLQKEGVLSVEERELMRMHPIWGVELLHDVEFPWPLKSIIRWHHERYDGSGYPDGLEGDQIPLEAQVVGLVEVYDALLTQRQDGTRYSEAQARAFVAARRGVWWSAWVVDAFLKAC